MLGATLLGNEILCLINIYFGVRLGKSSINKLAKARKMRKPPGTPGLKKFGPGKFWVEKVWAQKIEKVKEKLRKLKKI